MNDDMLIVMAVGGGLMLLIVIAIPLLYAKLYKKVAAGQALLVNKMSRVEVYFTGALAIPTVHKAEVMDISVKQVAIDRRGKEGVICKDDIRADVRAVFFVRVNQTAEDVRKVAQAIGVERASRQETLEELFGEKFSEAIKVVARRLEFQQLYTQRAELKDEILAYIGEDLSGYVLDDLAIDYLEQTPIDMLDPNNILDAKGIRKITELTTEQQTATLELRKEAQRRKAEREREVTDLLLELEQRRADGLAKLRADTGRSLTVEQLEQRLDDRLRAMVDEAVEARLG